MALALLFPLVSALSDEAEGFVTYVTDGDTITVDGVGVVRLADVDSPELAAPGGPEAKEYTRMPLGQENQSGKRNLVLQLCGC